MIKSRILELRHWLVPSRHNDFHPHLIAKRGLMILFALILGAEGFLVSNVLSSEAGAPSLATVASAERATAVLPPGIQGITRVWLEYVTIPAYRLAVEPQTGRIAFYGLLCLVGLLMVIITFTISAHRIRYKPIGYIAGGTMLAFATLLVFYDTHVLLPSLVLSEQAAVRESQIVLGKQPHITEANVDGVLATSTRGER